MIVALLVLHLFHLLETIGQPEQTLLYYWLEDQDPSHALTIIAGFVLAGILTMSRATIKSRLQLEKAKTKTLEENNREKTELISFTSHELRAPLTFLRGAVSMLLEGDFGQPSDKQKDILSKIYESNEGLLRLVASFLDVSKLELGKLEISLKRVSIAGLEKEIKKVVEALELVVKKKKIILNYHSSLNNELFVSADLKKINQVVGNLLENAINYTPAGGKISIVLENDKDNFKVSISDSGIGIPKKEQAKIFGKYFRGTNAREYQSTGTGLGLYLCKQFIEGHEGKIWFLSEEKKGTTFNFTIPLRAKAELEELFRKI